MARIVKQSDGTYMLVETKKSSSLSRARQADNIQAKYDDGTYTNKQKNAELERAGFNLVAKSSTLRTDNQKRIKTFDNKTIYDYKDNVRKNPTTETQTPIKTLEDFGGNTNAYRVYLVEKNRGGNRTPFDFDNPAGVNFSPNEQADNEAILGQGQNRSSSYNTITQGRDTKSRANELINTGMEGKGENELSDLMRSIQEEKKRLAGQLKSEGQANNMNADLQGSFGQTDDIESLVDEVTQDRNEFYGVDKQREIIEKQLGLQSEREEAAKEQIKRQQEEAIQDLNDKQARARRDANALYFGGANSPTSTTTAGRVESTGRYYDELIENVQQAGADQLQQLDFDIRSRDLQAEALLMDFDLQERTAITNEVQRRLTQDKGTLQSILTSVDLTNLDGKAIMGIAGAYGVDAGKVLALQAVQKQMNEAGGEGTFLELQNKIADGTATQADFKQYYELDNLRQQNKKLKKEAVGDDEQVIVNGVNYTQMEKAADIAKKMQDAGASQQSIDMVLQSAGASLSYDSGIDFDKVQTVLNTANTMKGVGLSDEDIKGFLDTTLKSLGFNANVSIQRDLKEQLAEENQALQNLKLKKELSGELSPMEEAQLQELELKNLETSKKLYGDVVTQSKTGVEFIEQDGITIAQFGEAISGRYQCGEFVNDALGLTGAERMGDALSTKTDAPSFVGIENDPMPEAGGYFVMDLGTKEGHVGVINAVDSQGIYITDYNRFGEDNKGNGANGRREFEFVPYGSDEYKKIVGFGKPNTVGGAANASNVPVEIQTTAQSYLDAFNSGQISYTEALTKIGSSKDNAPLRDEFARQVAEQGGKRVVPVDSKMVVDTDRLINNLETLLKDNNYEYISGMAQGGLLGTGFGRNYISPKAADIFSILENISGSSSLKALIEAKADGATFGALSNQELNVLGSSANNLTSRIIKGEDGRIKSVAGSEEAVKKDIESLLAEMKRQREKMTQAAQPDRQQQAFQIIEQNTTGLNLDDEADAQLNDIFKK